MIIFYSPASGYASLDWPIHALLREFLGRKLGKMDACAALSLCQCNSPGLICSESNKVCVVVL